MHSTSSYDAQSKCPHNVECAKHRENEGGSFGKCWTWCAYMTMGTHMSIKAEAKKFGDIFSAHMESNPGGTAVG